MKKSLLLGVALAALALAAPASAELKFKPGEDARFNWANFDDLKKVDLKGETLTIFGPWRGEDEALVRSVLDYFIEATGVDVNYSSSENYEQQIVIDTQAGSPPNIAILPQPGLIAGPRLQGLPDAARRRHRRPGVKDNYGAGQSWVDLGTYKDKDGTEAFFAFPYKADVKSLVWYVPENFEDAGYEVPKTMEELKALTEQDRRRRRHAVVHRPRLGRRHRLAGDRLGRGHHAAHPAAGGLRQVGRRTRSRSTIRAVVDALDDFGWYRQERQVSSTAAPRRSPRPTSATARRASSPSPPKCYLHHQASFIPSFFPEGTELGEDADFFYLPPYAAKPDLGNPVLGAGTLAMITKDSQGGARLHRVPEDADRP